MRNIFIGLLIAGASVAYGAVPPMTVLVADSAGKPAYRGAIDAKGTFVTPKLQAGNYVVQFNVKKADVKSENYALFISAGKKKVQADSVSGEKFTGGGVAMRIEVAAGLNIAGQVTTGLATKVDKNGKKLVWIPQRLGSNLPAHWAAADSAEAREAMTSPTMSRQDLQNRQSQGVSLGQ